MLGLGLFAACVPEGQIAPPPPQVEVGPLIAGEPVRLAVDGAAPGALVGFAVGASPGAGPCPPALGACFGIAAPREVGRARADGAGRAELSVVTPRVALAAPVRWFQAASPGIVWGARAGRALDRGGRGRGTWMWRDAGRAHGTATFVGDPALEADERASAEAWGVGRVYESYEAPGAAWPLGVGAWHEALHAEGRQVQLLLSENTWIEPARQASLDALLQQRIVDLHAVVGPGGRYDAVHLDVEPHGLPDWAGGTPADHRARMGQLLDLFVHVRGWLDGHGASGIGLYADLVVWADGLPAGLGGSGSIGWTSVADRDGWFATLGATLDGVSLMAYERSTSAAVLSSVAWERANLACEVRVGLEADVGATWGALQDALVVLGEVEDDGAEVDLHSWSTWREASAAVAGP